MRSIILAAALLSAASSPAVAAVIATGTANRSGDGDTIGVGIIPGQTTHVRISVDKAVYTVAGTYTVGYDWKTPPCDISPAESGCMENRDYTYFWTYKIDALSWGIDVVAPALGFNGYSTVYKVLDLGVNFGVYLDENTYMNVPITWTIEAWTAGVPEPSSWAMMIGGMAIAGAMLRARRRSSFRPSPQRRDLQSDPQPSA